MRAAIAVSLVSWLVTLNGCSTPAERSVELSLGASRANVLDVMGDPDSRQLEPNGEALFYVKTAMRFVPEWTVLVLQHERLTHIFGRNAFGTPKVVFHKPAERPTQEPEEGVFLVEIAEAPR